MPKVTQTSARKADHIRINLDEDVRSGLTTGFERYHFTHQAIPELNLECSHPDLINDWWYRPGGQDQPHFGGGCPGNQGRHGARIAASGN